jgi:hypothetical protein|nr:MAG TPA: hypothetical protein [Bacteriophage sp.]
MIEHASHIREDFGLIPMWRCNWIILHVREFSIFSLSVDW